MKLTCGAPQCSELVEISWWANFRAKLYSKLHGGDFANFVFCPEHKERITHGEFNDGDPTTNPDLLEEQKKNEQT